MRINKTNNHPSSFAVREMPLLAGFGQHERLEATNSDFTETMARSPRSARSGGGRDAQFGPSKVQQTYSDTSAERAAIDPFRSTEGHCRQSPARISVAATSATSSRTTTCAQP